MSNEIGEVENLETRVLKCYEGIDGLRKEGYATFYDARDEKPDKQIYYLNPDGRIFQINAVITDDEVNGQTYISLASNSGESREYNVIRGSKQGTEEIDNSEVFVVSQFHPQVKKIVYENIVSAELFEYAPILKDLWQKEWTEIAPKIDEFRESIIDELPAEKIREIYKRLIELEKETHFFDRMNPHTRKQGDFLSNVIGTFNLKLLRLFPDLADVYKDAEVTINAGQDITKVRDVVRQFYGDTEITVQTLMEFEGEKVPAQNHPDIQRQIFARVIKPFLDSEKNDLINNLQDWLLQARKAQLEILVNQPLDNRERLEQKEIAKEIGFRPSELQRILARLADIKSLSALAETQDVKLPYDYRDLVPNVIGGMEEKIKRAINLLEDKVEIVKPEEEVAPVVITEKEEFINRLKDTAQELPERIQNEYISPLFEYLPKFPQIFEGVDLTALSKESLRKILANVNNYVTTDPRERVHLGKIRQGLEAVYEMGKSSA